MNKEPKPKKKKVLKKKVVTAAVNKLRKPSKRKFEIKVVGPKTKTKIKKLPK